MLALLKNRKGVTLVELLAVIVILGIIAAIAVPTIGGLIERQKENAAEASFTNVLAAGANYALANSLDATDTFTLTDLAAGGQYLSANPFDDFQTTLLSDTVIFTVQVNGSVLITAPTPESFTIDDIEVFVLP